MKEHSMPDNSGVNTGSINSGSINTGSGRVTQTVQISGDSQTSTTIEQIDQLLATLLASTGQLPPESAEIVAEEATWLRDEINNGQLHAGHIRHALGALATAAAPVLPIMAVVEDVTDLVLDLLH
jgi:hypothetical protein